MNNNNNDNYGNEETRGGMFDVNSAIEYLTYKFLDVYLLTESFMASGVDRVAEAMFDAAVEQGDGPLALYAELQEKHRALSAITKGLSMVELREKFINEVNETIAKEPRTIIANTSVYSVIATEMMTKIYEFLYSTSGKIRADELERELTDFKMTLVTRTGTMLYKACRKVLESLNYTEEQISKIYDECGKTLLEDMESISNEVEKRRKRKNGERHEEEKSKESEDQKSKTNSYQSLDDLLKAINKRHQEVMQENNESEDQEEKEERDADNESSQGDSD